MLGLLESQAAGVDGGEEDIVVAGGDAGEDGSDLFLAKDGGESVFGLGSEDPEDVPVPMEDMLIEELDAAIADAHGLGRPFAEVLAVKEVVLEFLFGDQLWALAVELGEHTNGASVSLLGAFPFAIELEGLDHCVVPICHHVSSPFANEFGET